jgi:hypothetical protein
LTPGMKSCFTSGNKSCRIVLISLSDRRVLGPFVTAV